LGAWDKGWRRILAKASQVVTTPRGKRDLPLIRLSRRSGLSVEAGPHGLRHQGITRLLVLVIGDVRKVQRFSCHAELETLM
jgi:hypothetical protein